MHDMVDNGLTLLSSNRNIVARAPNPEYTLDVLSLTSKVKEPNKVKGKL